MCVHTTPRGSRWFAPLTGMAISWSLGGDSVHLLNATSAGGPRRSGRWVRLAPITPGHYSFVRGLAVQDPAAFRSVFPERLPEPDVFMDRFLSVITTCFVVESVGRRRPAGVAYLYRWSGQHGFADFQVAMTPSLRGTGVGIEAARIFIDHVFNSLNIRKLYVTAASPQLRAFRHAIGDVLQEEGRLRDHAYLAGRWHDEHILAIERDRYRGWVSGHLALRTTKAVVEEFDAGGPAAKAVVGDEPTSRWQSLEGRITGLDSARVRLVAPGREHLPYLYGLATSEDVGTRWRFGGGVPTLREFERSFHQGVFAQFVPTLRSGGKPFGHLVAYQADQASGHAYVGGVTEARWHRTGYPIEAFAIFMRYLFTNWDFRKLYMELPEYNRSQVLARGMIGGLREEARLRDVVYHDGSWWDRSILAIPRTFFMASVGVAP